MKLRDKRDISKILFGHRENPVQYGTYEIPSVNYILLCNVLAFFNVAHNNVTHVQYNLCFALVYL